MKQKITVAAIQMDIVPLEKEINIRKALDFMNSALQESDQVDLFVLPEDFITGPIPNHTATHCLSNDSPEVATFISFAKDNSCYIVLGSFIKRIGKNLFNTTLVIDPKGDIILEHYKTKLSGPERSYITPGTKLNVVSTDIGTIGILNCWELADPLIARELVKKGADILCSPSWWASGDLPVAIGRLNANFDADFANSVLPSLAFQFNVLVVYANVSGDAGVQLKTKVWKSYGMGQSQICAPIVGRVQHMNDPKAEGCISYQYDRATARLAEEMTSLRADLK